MERQQLGITIGILDATRFVLAAKMTVPSKCRLKY